MKKLVVWTGIVWASSLVSAGALAFVLRTPSRAVDLDRPAALELTQAVLPVAVATVAAKVVTAQIAPPSVEVEASPVVITADTPRSAPRPRPAARSLEQMRCTGWRELTQGPVAQGVRYCD